MKLGGARFIPCFIFAMNWDAFDALPFDFQTILARQAGTSPAMGDYCKSI